MRVVRVFLFLLPVIVFGSKIDQKINRSQQTLQHTEAQKQQMNRQLSRIAARIRAQRAQLGRLEQALDRLAAEKSQGESRYKDAMRQIAALENQIATLTKRLQIQHQRFIDLLTDQFAMIVALEEMKRTDERSVILREYFDAYRKVSDRQLGELKTVMERSRKNRAALIAQRDRLQASIAAVVKKRKLYLKKKAEVEKLLQKLAKDEAAYRQKLKNLITRQNLLRLTLAKLNILRKEEIEEARRREAERKAQIERRARRLAQLRKEKAAKRAEAIAQGKAADYSDVSLPESPGEENETRVKRYGSSYQRARIAVYRGPRTISPLPGARLVKKFGTYVDPIYKIKIFNDSITLKAPSSDARVRNVLNGKVVYVGQNAMLGKVVIIQHRNGIHTVYAGLSKISPLVHTGTRLKKGGVVGKVRRKLIFQATQHERLINPLQLIRL